MADLATMVEEFRKHIARGRRSLLDRKMKKSSEPRRHCGISAGACWADSPISGFIVAKDLDSGDDHQRLALSAAGAGPADCSGL